VRLIFNLLQNDRQLFAPVAARHSFVRDKLRECESFLFNSKILIRLVGACCPYTRCEACMSKFFNQGYRRLHLSFVERPARWIHAP